MAPWISLSYVPQPLLHRSLHPSLFLLKFPHQSRLALVTVPLYFLLLALPHQSLALVPVLVSALVPDLLPVHFLLHAILLVVLVLLIVVVPVGRTGMLVDPATVLVLVATVLVLLIAILVEIVKNLCHSTTGYHIT